MLNMFKAESMGGITDIGLKEWINFVKLENGSEVLGILLGEDPASLFRPKLRENSVILYTAFD